MIRIFQPILPNILIHIDDLLLFSNTPEKHHQLLHQFVTIIEQHGIMLSQAKMEIGKREIDFVGTHLQDGTYTLQPHISTALQKFPDHLSSPKIIQQFLGLVNYMADFIPHIAKHRAILSPLLSKKAPPWNSQHLKAVQALKKHSKHLPPLHIPGHSTARILQTDASNHFWGAVIYEEDDGKRNICGYKSGSFSTAEAHYHSTFKKILAVKRGIKKFQFHLTGRTFTVEMDSSTFPQMLHFKQKVIPNAQLLRWAAWFANWSFTVKHIKGRHNELANLLSRRPQLFHPAPAPIALLFPLSPVSPQDPLSLISHLPPDIQAVLMTYIQQTRSTHNFHTFLTIQLRKHGRIFTHIPHPQYPFLAPFTIRRYYHLSKEALCFLWYLFEKFTIAFIFDVSLVSAYITQAIVNPAVPRHLSHFSTLLKWFHPLPIWQSLFTPIQAQYAIVTFHNPTDFIQDFSDPPPHPPHSYYTHSPVAHLQNWSSFHYMTRCHFHPAAWDLFQESMCALNHTSIDQIPPNILADPTAHDDGHPISASLFEGLLNFFERTGHLGDSSSDESPFTGYPGTNDSE